MKSGDQNHPGLTNPEVFRIMTAGQVCECGRAFSDIPDNEISAHWLGDLPGHPKGEESKC